MEPEDKEAHMRANREDGSILRASRGRERASGSMSKGTERLIHLVNDGKPKDAERLGPKGQVDRIRCSPLTVHSRCSTGEKAVPTLPVDTLRNVVSPILSQGFPG